MDTITTRGPLLRCGACGSLSWSFDDDECLACGESCRECRGVREVWVLTEPGETWDLVDCGSCRP